MFKSSLTTTRPFIFHQRIIQVEGVEAKILSTKPKRVSGTRLKARTPRAGCPKRFALARVTLREVFDVIVVR